MKKIIFILLVLFCSTVSLVFADEIYLSNGEVLQGNILNVNKAQGLLDINLIVDGELTGTIMTFKKDEMIHILQDGKYKGLIHKEVTPEEREQQLKMLKKRHAQANITTRERLNKLQAKRWREQKRLDELKHEMKVLKLKHEQRKDLITHSKKEYVSPSVIINDSEPNVINIGVGK